MISFKQVTKIFPDGNIALQDVSFEIKEKEFVFITGPSGAGKTSVFNLITGLDKVSKGWIKFQNWNINNLPIEKIPLLRSKIGIVFQGLKLLFDRNVYENIAVALEVLGYPTEKIKKKVINALEVVGMNNTQNKYPLQLSGGELQRIAIARAIVKKPEVLLADEPTAELDPVKSWGIVKLLCEINEGGTTVLMATHNLDIVNSLGKRVISLDRGRIIKDEEKGKY